MSDDHQTARTDSFPVLPWNNKDDIDALIERIGTKQIVMLGEASHGTHEYYEWRAEITKRLIAEGGFTFVAVEGDWPDCYAINRYVKGYDTSSKSAKEVLSNFTRWPSWMWANEEVAEFAEWLREHNQDRPKSERVGFYGLDVYSLWDSMQAVVQHLQKVDPQSADKVKEAYRCFDPYGGNETAYAYDTPFVPGKCEDEVIKALELLTDKLQDHSNDGEADFNAQQNARVVRNAEQYYRTMVRGNAASWNVRDRHMHETLQALLDRQVGESKAIIWAHNTHIGDASATDMSKVNMFNIGQLARETFGRANVALVGFGSYAGEVIAGQYWDAPMEVMTVPPAKSGSFESAMHGLGGKDFLIPDTTKLPKEFCRSWGHRAIGVVYNPEYDRAGNYVPSVIPKRYDAFIFIDETTALRPLKVAKIDTHKLEETYPTGM